MFHKHPIIYSIFDVIALLYNILDVVCKDAKACYD